MPRSWSCGMRSRCCVGRSPARDRTGLTAPGSRPLRGPAQAAAAAPDRDAGHAVGLAPAPCQDEMDLPEHPRSAASLGRGATLVAQLAGEYPRSGYLRIQGELLG